MTIKTVVIFGVFDGLHQGHLEFIQEAKIQGQRLVVILARDDIVLKLKNKLPLNNEVDRINELLKTPEIDLVLLGDPELSTYNTLKEVNPDIIFFGYDQQTLLDDIKMKISKKYLPKIELKQGKSHKKKKLHSSILNKK